MNNNNRKPLNRADVKLAVMRLLLLPDDSKDFTAKDYEFLRSEICGKILAYWPSHLLNLNLLAHETKKQIKRN